MTLNRIQVMAEGGREGTYVEQENPPYSAEVLEDTSLQQLKAFVLPLALLIETHRLTPHLHTPLYFQVTDDVAREIQY